MLIGDAFADLLFEPFGPFGKLREPVIGEIGNESRPQQHLEGDAMLILGLVPVACVDFSLDGGQGTIDFIKHILLCAICNSDRK